MGFYRVPQPASLDRQGVTAAVVNFICEQEIAVLLRELDDPFAVAHDCRNPQGHDPIASCGEIVCCHCGQVFWR